MERENRLVRIGAASYVVENNSCLLVKMNVIEKAFGVTIQSAEPFGNIGQTWTTVCSSPWSVRS